MIVFTQNIDADKLRMAYNNDVIEFYDNQGILQKYCDIVIGSVQVRIYPSPGGVFTFNFKNYVKSLVNTRNFVDDLVTDIVTTWVYNFSEGTVLSTEVKLTIALIDGTLSTLTQQLHWLAGVEQRGGYDRYSSSGMYILSPFDKLTANTYYIKYWQGYPFDLPIYNTGGTVYLYNKSNLMEAHFQMLGAVNRLLFSDGRSDVTIEDTWPLDEGFNKIRIQSSEIPSDKDLFMTIEKVAVRCGVYLKWLNQYGCYNYWLFESTYSVERSSKQIGEIANDRKNINQSFAPTLQMGKESQDTIRIIAELLSSQESRIVEGILDSPKVYLFTGEPYSRAGVFDWVEVSLKSSNARIRNPKQQLINFAFDIELPMRDTQTL